MPKPTKPTGDVSAAGPTDPAPRPDVPASALVRAPSGDESNALAVLADAGFAVDAGSDIDDGLGEVAVTDLRTPYKLFNLKQADGVARIAQDQFLDTIDRTVSDRLRVVLLDMHKTNLYSRFIQKDNRNETVCQSFDRKTGTWAADGHERPCNGCPDAVWRTERDNQGNVRRTVPCGEVWNVAAFDLDTQRVCLIKFKKTSLDAIRSHVQAHHIGRLPRPGGKRGNIPLCAYEVAMHMEMHKGGNHAVPKLTRGAMLGAADMRLMHETAQGVRETFEARMRAADESAASDRAADDGGGDTSFDTAAMDAAGNAERGSEAFVE